MNKIILIIIALSFNLPVFADSEISQKLKSCQAINDDAARLECYDQLVNKNNIPQIDSAKKTVNEFPALIADLNEPNLHVSFGSLDFLGDTNRAVLLSAGNRLSVKDYEFSKGKSLSFNVFGQIRSQFDVDELDTRNNRGGALINTDFSVGGELVQSLNNWNWRFSYTHRSTHLGDEFLIDNPEFLESRLNLSYEQVRWDAHKKLKNWDLYAGVGFITRSEPGNLDKYLWPAGWQFQGDQWYFIKPIWAVDLNSWGAYDWNINMNMRAGIEIIGLSNSPFQVLLEYYDGHSPYGQFFTEDLTYSGITLLKNW